MAMNLVETITVTASGGVTTLEFANIPQTGKDLMILFSLRDRISGEDTGQILLNNSSSNFRYSWIKGTGSTTAASEANFNYLDSVIVPNNYTNNTFSNFQLYITNYAGSTNKCISWDTVLEQNNQTNLLVLGGMRWSNTAAISNLKYSQFTANAIAQNSTASLYIIS